MTWIKKALLLSAVAAALAVTVGASSASATVLCKSSPVGNVCPVGQKYGVGEEIKSRGTSFKFKAGFQVIECHQFALDSVITKAGGENAQTELHVTNFAPTSCNNGQTFTLNEKGNLRIGWVSGSANGNLELVGGSFTVRVGSTECTYGGTTGIEGSSMSVIGGYPGKYSAAETRIEKIGGGVLCANPAKLTLETETVNSALVAVPLYVAKS